jgi:L-threonylcarbamoyladenylate synthase
VSVRIIRADIRTARLDAIKEAAAVLKRGGTVVYPTETAYAIGCDATDAAAVKRIFTLKERDAAKPLPMIVASSGMARRFARFGAFEDGLAAAFWPGPLTLVLPAKKSIAAGAVSRRGEIALRVSAADFARALSRTLGRPIVSTSANRSGGGNPYRLADALRDFGAQPDLCIDGGTLPRRKPSTIIRCGADRCEILRQGPVSAKAVARALAVCV